MYWVGMWIQYCLPFHCFSSWPLIQNPSDFFPRCTILNLENWGWRNLSTINTPPDGSAGKESACNVGDLGSIPGLGRSLGEGNSYLLQYSGLENSMDCIAHGVAKSQTWLSDFYFPLWLIILVHPKAILDLESFFPTGQHKGAPFKEKLSLMWR